MPTIKKVTDLIINKVESQKVYDYMVSQNLINDDELYLIEDKELITVEDIDAICIIPIEVVPYQDGALTYNGTVQSPIWNGYNSSQLTIGGTTSATNAGTYTATFIPNSGYAWSDGSKDAKSMSWMIGKATISTVPSQSGSLTYTGSTLSPSWSNYDSSKLTIDGTTSGTNAGSYTATFTPIDNYMWSDSTTTAKSVTWTIDKAFISKPTTSSSFTYNGSVCTPTWSNYDSSKMTIGGNTSATNAGTYTTTFTLESNYQWSDGTTSVVSISWSIGKAAGSLSISPTTLTLNSDTTSDTITVTRAGDGAISAVSSDTSVATVSVSDNVVTVNSVNGTSGTATITISVAAGTNHTAPADVTCAVTTNFVVEFTITLSPLPEYYEPILLTLVDGMTWGEWIDSDYNTINVAIKNNTGSMHHGGVYIDSEYCTNITSEPPPMYHFMITDSNTGIVFTESDVISSTIAYTTTNTSPK